MTVSAALRREHVHTTLKRMGEAVGDDSRFNHVFRADDPRFTSILETTWRDMLDAGLIEDMALSDFLLTPRGWISALKQTGSRTNDQVQQRATKIVSALKKRVKGRHGLDDEFVDVRVLADELHLPIGWLENAMEAQLLQHVFGDRVALGYDGVLIRVPPTFGCARIAIE